MMKTHIDYNMTELQRLFEQRSLLRLEGKDTKQIQNQIDDIIYDY